VDACKKLADLSLELGFFLIYVSTDYVFDGTNPPYNHTDIPNPLNFYGKSKLEGERAIEGILKEYCILRIPILYGQVEYNAESAVNILMDSVTVLVYFTRGQFQKY
jgi:S-adenosylmethionine synthetase